MESSEKDLKQGNLTGWHSCSDLGLYHNKIKIPLVSKYLRDDRLCFVNLDKIYIKRKCRVANKTRYEGCCLAYPLIICQNVPNPENKPYRMIDGSHRASKAINEYRWRQAMCYILTSGEFYNLLEESYNYGKNMS